MKNVNKLAVVLSLVLAGAFATSAALRAEATDPMVYVESYRAHSPAEPAPVRVVVPSSAVLTNKDDKTGSVDVTFVVDAKGKPTEISVAYASDEALVEPVIEAVERWQFIPATRDGVPVASKVLLPVRFTVASNE